MTGHYRLSVFLLLVVFVAIPAAVAVHPQTQAEADAPPGVGPAGAEWPRVGGDLGGMRYSKLTQITTENVKNLSGAWVTRFDRGLNSRATPVVRDGLMFLTAGTSVYALNAKTGETVWKRMTVPAPGATLPGLAPQGPGPGSPNRHGVSLGDGKVFVGLRNGVVLALHEKTGEVIWEHQVFGDEPPLKSYAETVSEATTYWQGMVFAATGGDWGTPARIVALDANTGKERWVFWTVPRPGEKGSETWPKNSDLWKYGGGGVWMEAVIDPDLQLVYYVTGNASPQYGGELRAGDNLFTASIVALDIQTGTLRWHYQFVHHDIWEHDIGTPPIMYDIQMGGQIRKGIGIMRTDGYLFFLDRATGKPLLPVQERIVPQDSFSKTARTQPFPVGGESVIPTCSFWRDKVPAGFELGCEFAPKQIGVPNMLELGTRVLIAPMSHSPQTGYFYAQGYAGLVWARRSEDPYFLCCLQGNIPKIPGLLRFATLAAIDTRTGKIAWKKEMPWAVLGRGGTMNTAGGLLFRLQGDGNFTAFDEKTGEVLWQFQTGFPGGYGTPATFELEGEQYIAVPAGPAVWTFKLGGSMRPLPAPILPLDDDPFTGPIEDTWEIETASLQRGLFLSGQHWLVDEYALNPYRARVLTGTRVTWVNNGRENHTLQALDGSWTTGPVKPGALGLVKFEKPGTHTYICKDHPWTYGQLIVVDEQTHQDGIYTLEQAGRGNAAYAQGCRLCHGNDLGGSDEIPPLVGTEFMVRWGGRSVGDLFNTMRATMPPTSPGSLSEQATLDLVAFLLRANQLPAGTEALTSSTETFTQTVSGR